MSIGKRVSEAIDKMEASDPEGALFAICAALEATATKEFGKPGRASYKDFLHQNLALITRVAFGPKIMNMRLQFSHPHLQANADGVYTFEEILYHAVRCGMYHEAELPSNLHFIPEKQIRAKDGALFLASSLIYGLIVAVLVAPVNASETALKASMFNLGDLPIPIRHLWGRRAELAWLLEAVADADSQRKAAEATHERGAFTERTRG